MRKVGIIILISAFVLMGGLLFWGDILDFYSQIFFSLPQVKEEISNLSIKETETQISLPPPLRAKEQAPEAVLTTEGVIEWTNIQRQKYNLPPLKENIRLNISAQTKLQDMFQNQYFSHFSPSGAGVEEWVEIAGYEFVAMGENLALGNFEDDQALVQGWMESPGHRKNILNPQYQEIGVAVGKGELEGESTWLAVQHFGAPLSACPQPDEELKTEIEINKNEIGELKETLQKLEIEIRKMRPKRGRAYNQKIKQYNQLVAQYNTLVHKTKFLIQEYNFQVQKFNQCVTGGK